VIIVTATNRWFWGCWTTDPLAVRPARAIEVNRVVPGVGDECGVLVERKLIAKRGHSRKLRCGAIAELAPVDEHEDFTRMH
jgi:hypothetical protein